MKTYIIKIRPYSSISNFPSSDTLFGAFCWGIRYIYTESELVGMLDKFYHHKNSFILSSCFPMLSKNNYQIYFFPTPCLPDITPDETDELAQKYETKFNKGKKYSMVKVMEELKKLKKVEFVSEKIFSEIINGKMDMRRLSENYYAEGCFPEKKTSFTPENLGGRIKLLGKFLLNSEEYLNFFGKEKRPPSLIKSEIIQKNLIDRFTMSTSGAGELYYSSEIFLNPLVKLYFLVRTNNIDYFKPVLRWLSDTGIGGDRTSGRNQYEISDNIKEMKLPESLSPNCFINLSRFLPKKNEIDFSKKPLFYNLLPYRSKVESSVFRDVDIWKKRIIYFKEGSIFPLKEKKFFYGELKDIKEIKKKKIKQNGLTIPVFGKIGELNG